MSEPQLYSTTRTETRKCLKVPLGDLMTTHTGEMFADHDTLIVAQAQRDPRSCSEAGKGGSHLHFEIHGFSLLRKAPAPRFDMPEDFPEYLERKGLNVGYDPENDLHRYTLQCHEGTVERGSSSGTLLPSSTVIFSWRTGFDETTNPVTGSTPAISGPGKRWGDPPWPCFSGTPTRAITTRQRSTRRTSDRPHRRPLRKGPTDAPSERAP